jgi:hypothetical protein
LVLFNQLMQFFFFFYLFQCTVEEAYSRARYDWMREALRAWVDRQGWADQLHLVDPPPKLSPEPSPVAGNGSLDAYPALPQLPGHQAVQPDTPAVQS